jgi:hypothetical protein
MRIGVYKRLIAGMANVEDEVSAERGPFSLFALIEKEDWNESDNYPLGSSWHLFVAAPWIWDEGYTAEKFLQERVRPYEEGWSTFESSLRIHVVKPTSAYLEEVWEYCSTENGIVEVYNVDILDVTARRGYIFASRCPADFAEIRLHAQLEAEHEAQRQDQLVKENRNWPRAQLHGQGGP